jgi:hypothetical protein
MLKFGKGDVVAGNKGASLYYKITRGGTQWSVYDTEHDNILLGKVVPAEKYMEIQNEYDACEDKELFLMTNPGFHWVEAQYFRLVFRRIVNSNADALNLLEKDIDEALSMLPHKEVVR